MKVVVVEAKTLKPKGRSDASGLVDTVSDKCVMTDLDVHNREHSLHDLKKTRYLKWTNLDDQEAHVIGIDTRR